MSMTYEVPLSRGSQSFTLELEKTYQFVIVWREGVEGGGWFLDVSDDAGSPLVLGLPLVVGTNLLDQFSYLELGELWVELDGREDRALVYDDVGTTARLYWRAP